MPVLVYVSMVVDEVWNKRTALFLNQTWEIKVKVTKNNEALILSPCVQDKAGLFFVVYAFSLCRIPISALPKLSSVPLRDLFQSNAVLGKSWVLGSSMSYNLPSAIGVPDISTLPKQCSSHGLRCPQGTQRLQDGEQSCVILRATASSSPL